MSLPAPLDRGRLLARLARNVLPAQAWSGRLAQLDHGRSPSALHIAIMREPYLQLVLEGRKTIESRFSVNRVPPYRAVDTGDVLVLKAQSGPIVGLALVEHAGFYELDPATWKTLRRDFGVPLCADDDAFWEQRSGARYATLLRVAYPLRIAPVPLAKTDRRGWVRLPASDSQQTLAL